MEAPPSCDSNRARPASTSLEDSPNFRRARTAAARLGIRRMNCQSSIFLNSCGVSIIWSRCPRVTEGCLLAGVNERPPLGFPCGLLVAASPFYLLSSRRSGVLPDERDRFARKRLGVFKPPNRCEGQSKVRSLRKPGRGRPRTAPTSDQIPASAPADDFMHAHKWKRGVRENVATVREIRRKQKSHPPTIKALCNICPTKVSGPRRSPFPE